MNAPCKNCSERHERCHSNCEKYISYRKKLDDINNEERFLKNLERPCRIFKDYRR